MAKKQKKPRVRLVKTPRRARAATSGNEVRVEVNGMTTVIDPDAGTVTVELPPDYVSPLQMAGRELAEAERFEEAVAKFTEALDEIPDHPGILSDRGRAHLFLKNAGLAFEDTKAALQIDPGNAT